MINLKNLKSLFIVDESENKSSEEDKTSEKTNVTPPPQDNKQTPPPLPKPVAGSEGKVDKRVYEMLLQVIESNNLEGFDYLEFKASVQALNNLPLDEATKFRSAFATASTMGLTIDKLTSSVDFYKNVLNRERDRFKTELENKMEESVVSKEKERKSLEDTVRKKEDQITQLTNEITQHKQALSQLQNQLAEVQNKIEQTQNAFFGTHQYLLTQFEDDVQKIKKYLIP